MMTFLIIFCSVIFCWLFLVLVLSITNYQGTHFRIVKTKNDLRRKAYYVERNILGLWMKIPSSYSDYGTMKFEEFYELESAKDRLKTWLDKNKEKKFFYECATNVKQVVYEHSMAKIDDHTSKKDYHDL